MSDASDAFHYNWAHMRTNYRYETEDEEKRRTSPQFLKPGYKLIDKGNSPAQSNWWHPIFNTIEMEEAVLESWTEGDQTFQYVTQEEMDKANEKPSEDDYSDLCLVLMIMNKPYEARGYWFVEVYYFHPGHVGQKFRTADLMFNNKAEADAVKQGDKFNWNEQFE